MKSKLSVLIQNRVEISKKVKIGTEVITTTIFSILKEFCWLVVYV